MSNEELIAHKNFGFDSEKYISMQKNQILDRMSQFSGKLYLEVYGKLFKDFFASRILPGYLFDTKKIIFSDLKDKLDVLYCVDSKDIILNKKMEDDLDFSDYVASELLVIERTIWIKPVLVINNIDVANMFDLVLDFERKFQKKQYRVFERYKINWYPYNLDEIIWENGFAGDDHIPLFKNLILVTWATRDSWQTATSLGQIYLDNELWIKSGYASYQIFPFWNKPLDNSVNIAYDKFIEKFWDSLVIDEKHLKEYKQEVVVTKKDSDFFDTFMNIVKNIVNHKNYMIKYKSTKDISINTTSFCITDEEIINDSAKKELERLEKE